MIYAVIYEDEIRLWWDKRKGFQEGYIYKITIDGTRSAFTKNVYYDFKNLEAGREYLYTVELLDKDKNPVGKSESRAVKTLPYKAKKDVTKPPYNAVGDGVTDNTESIQRAFDECGANEYVYFPLGVYACNALKFGGDIKVHFDSGANLCALEDSHKTENVSGADSLHTVIFDNEIKLWWDYYSECKEGCVYRVFLNGNLYKETEKTHCSFKNLEPATTYLFRVELVNESGAQILDLGEKTATTYATKRKIDVTKAPYYAVGDGKTVNTKALQKALDDCTASDCVYFPAGVYLSGALDVKSDTEILLHDDAVLQGTVNASDYLPKRPSRFEGHELECYSSLLNVGKMDHTAGYTCKNVVIRGGKICGGGAELRKDIISTEAERILSKMHFEEGETPPLLYSNVLPGRMRGRLINVNNAQNVIIANTEAGNAPAWNIHIVYSDNVVMCGSKIFSNGISNGDGFDPDSSSNCTVFDMYFDTGDDCVAIKSGRNPDGNIVNIPCEHIRVFDCWSKGGHGIAIGSEMSGGINDVKIWDCDVETSFAGLHFKTTRERGGYIKNVCVYNTKAAKIHIDTAMAQPDDGAANPTPPILENFHFENITIGGIEYYTNSGRMNKADAVTAGGYSDGYAVKNIKLKNITLKYRVMTPWHHFLFKEAENVEIENIICE